MSRRRPSARYLAERMVRYLTGGRLEQLGSRKYDDCLEWGNGDEVMLLVMDVLIAESLPGTDLRYGLRMHYHSQQHCPPQFMEIVRSLGEARELKYRVVFRDFCEDADTPGFPGRIGGKCDTERQQITVSLRRNFTERRTPAEVAAILSHEVEHAAGKDKATDRPDLGLRCGGMVGGREVLR